jgi:[NiFe] hydrogenase assembly HybE family chaperone
VNDRVCALEALFARIAVTRMQGVPLLNERLRVQALGFETEADGAQAGVLVTPWFMNLVRLPPAAGDAAGGAVAVGATVMRRVGTEVFPFIGAREDGFGAYEACSLFSPMFEFADHDAALATARAVLDTLRQPAHTADAGPAASSRRALLFGRDGARP